LTALSLVLYFSHEPNESQGGTHAMISEELLEILRCPYCVSGETRKPGDDPGRLEVAHDCWLVCQEFDCGRKYPIRDDIPVMLIDEGDKWINVAVKDLPVPPPAE
jgi:uncharacterized protein YbaR (Trm112 family)